LSSTMTMHYDYDIAIIGSGAGGGTLAYALANSGKRVVILERGGYLPREKQNWDATAVFVDQRYHTEEMWTDKDDKPIRPGTGYYVGGNTKVWGGALMRLREGDFGEVTHFDGVSPAWPLSYTDFAPYYTQAEDLYGVHGTRASDPTEPPAAGPYPWPAVTHEPRIQEVYDGLEAHGYHPFPLPQAIRLDEKNRQVRRAEYLRHPRLARPEYRPRDRRLRVAPRNGRDGPRRHGHHRAARRQRR